MPFVCCSITNQEEDDYEVFWSSTSPTPSTKTPRNSFCCTRRRRRSKKNPYSNRGIDKFEALLADLDDKKRKIFTQKGSQYISLVRFVYSNSNHVKPIIVRLRDPKGHDHKGHDHKQNDIKQSESSSLPKLQIPTFDHQETHHVKTPIHKVIHMVTRVDHLWKPNLKRKLEEWWMPSYNLPLFVIIVVLFLTLFGRSLAIICTSIAWYVIPKVDGTVESTTTTPKKMITNHNHSRKTSKSKVISSPKSFFSGPLNVRQDKTMKKLMTF